MSICALFAEARPSNAGNKNYNRECAVILHGLARTKVSMRTMETAFQKKGYKTVNRGYPWTSKSIAEIAREEVAEAARSG